MSAALNDSTVRCVLLDIEGTTTPIDFVYQVLFPFAREHARDYLTRHWSTAEVQVDLIRLREEQSTDAAQGLNPPVFTLDSPQAYRESAVAYLHWLIERDRKSTPLKSLQGKIWEEGYRAGELLSQVFADVPLALERWHGRGLQICIYSSGSVLAQKLLFSHTIAGDLTRFLSRYFDTGVGAKAATESYQRIAAELQQPPSEIVFISDVVAELDAAHVAGLQCVLSRRPGNHPQPPAAYQVIGSFDELF